MLWIRTKGWLKEVLEREKLSFLLLFELVSSFLHDQGPEGGAWSLSFSPAKVFNVFRTVQYICLQLSFPSAASVGLSCCQSINLVPKLFLLQKPTAAMEGQVPNFYIYYYETHPPTTFPPLSGQKVSPTPNDILVCNKIINSCHLSSLFLVPAMGEHVVGRPKIEEEASSGVWNL